MSGDGSWLSRGRTGDCGVVCLSIDIDSENYVGEISGSRTQLETTKAEVAEKRVWRPHRSQAGDILVAHLQTLLLCAFSLVVSGKAYRLACTNGRVGSVQFIGDLQTITFVAADCRGVAAGVDWQNRKGRFDRSSAQRCVASERTCSWGGCSSLQWQEGSKRHVGDSNWASLGELAVSLLVVRNTSAKVELVTLLETSFGRHPILRRVAAVGVERSIAENAVGISLAIDRDLTRALGADLVAIQVTLATGTGRCWRCRSLGGGGSGRKTREIGVSSGVAQALLLSSGDDAGTVGGKGDTHAFVHVVASIQAGSGGHVTGDSFFVDGLDGEVAGHGPQITGTICNVAAIAAGAQHGTFVAAQWRCLTRLEDVEDGIGGGQRRECGSHEGCSEGSE